MLTFYLNFYIIIVEFHEKVRKKEKEDNKFMQVAIMAKRKTQVYLAFFVFSLFIFVCNGKLHLKFLAHSESRLQDLLVGKLYLH